MTLIESFPPVRCTSLSMGAATAYLFKTVSSPCETNFESDDITLFNRSSLLSGRMFIIARSLPCVPKEVTAWRKPHQTSIIGRVFFSGLAKHRMTSHGLGRYFDSVQTNTLIHLDLEML